MQEFEERFAEFVGAAHAVAVTSGTSSLHLALLAHGIGPGDEVITPAFSFVASADCALFVGARPVFADIEPMTFTLDPSDLERASRRARGRSFRFTSSARRATWKRSPVSPRPMVYR